MTFTLTHVITNVVTTESADTTLYGLGDDGRVFLARGQGAPADRRWDAFGFLARPVEIGQPVIIVVDDILTLTSPVVGNEMLAAGLPVG